MARRILFGALILTAMIFAGTGTRAMTVSRVLFVNHDIRLAIDMPSHLATVNDSGMAKLSQGWNLFELSNKANIERLLINGRSVDFQTMSVADIGRLEFHEGSKQDEIDTSGQSQLILFEFDRDGILAFSIDYSAEFYQDVSNTRFSNEMVGKEISGTVLEQGAYLSSSSFYYPVGSESLVRFTLTADIPGDWESVCDGNRVGSRSSEDGSRKIQSWENPFQSDGCTFMAAPYVTRSTWVDSIEIACYFFAADTGLFEEYLSATADYIRMYNELIGEYPYKRFTVAENFFPTGYGMPAWTLLGQQVLRLPFIKYTSLGHEVLHNWWGNSVYVDHARGNWCESATVYGADYRYKLMRSPDDARQYRKDILKQYNSYVNEGNDFPIREFRSRTNPGSRTIGYNKAMMVYHMIEEEIGTEPFFATWKEIYKNYREKQISWEEWMAVFEKVSGDDLSYVIPQWIDQPGAPLIDIADVKVDSDAGSIQFRLLENSEQNYRLTVPLRFTGANSAVDTSVILNNADSLYTVPLPKGSTTLAIDPDYHLFRQLYPEEVEAVVSATMGNLDKSFVADMPSEMAEAFAAFGENLSGDTIEIAGEDALSLTQNSGALIVLNPTMLPDGLHQDVTRSDDSIVVDGTSYLMAGHTFVLTGKDWEGFDDYMVVISNDGASLARIGQLIPHYGKYSFLIFEGPKNVGKGNWEATKSRLRVSLE